jgi:DNA-nicking Smr family endonuclease
MTMEANKPMTDAVLPLPDMRKRQIRRVVPEFLANCRSHSIFEARIVHGTTDPRTERALHDVLKDLPEVACFRTGGPQAGTSRATIVVLLGLDELPPGAP